MKEKIGEYFMRLDLLSFEQAEEILKAQRKNPARKFGQIALDLGYISREDLDEAIADSL